MQSFNELLNLVSGIFVKIFYSKTKIQKQQHSYQHQHEASPTVQRWNLNSESLFIFPTPAINN